MSEPESIGQVIEFAAERFNSIVKSSTSALVYDAEKGFAVQLLHNNSYLKKVAMESPASLQAAICNVAAINLSLNPAEKLAYLIPRNMKVDNKWVNKIFLEPSYMGLIRLATDSGSIEWCQSRVVRANDTFVETDVGKQPKHECNVFGVRGEIVGVYCVAKTKGGDYLTTTMTLAEINKIMETSETVKQARKKGNEPSGPWVTYFEEQAKKTVIRRAFKTWPRSNQNAQMAEAIHLSNENEGFEPLVTSPDLGKFTVGSKAYFDQLFENDENLEMYVLQQTTPNREFTSLYHSFPEFNDYTKEQKKEGAKGKGHYQKILDEMIRDGEIEFNKYLVEFQNGGDIESEVSEAAYTLIKDRAT